jgi:Na+-transporting NADH:ubiquinone oxidoreductase subunit C
MALDKNSNAFTFGFAIIMVVIVGLALSLIAIGLKPMQVENRKQDKMMDILSALQIESSRTNASDLFEKFIVERIVINNKGEVLNNASGEIDIFNLEDAFNVDVQKQHRDRSLSESDKRFPLFVCEKDGVRFYVVPMVGKGLWGPIWGYVALKDDYNTVYGASFDHKGETPGLGAEISIYNKFQKPFEGKQIYDKNGNLVSILVRKGGATPGNMHEVDGITGGTITSDGVTEMLERTFKIYDNYFSAKRAS